MSKPLDHLNPANWFPFYDYDTGRRAVPAAWLFRQEDEPTAYLFTARAEALGYDSWVLVEGLDQITRGPDQGKIVVEYGRTGEAKLTPDALVYVHEVLFQERLESVLTALPLVFSDLWNFVERKQMSRAEFDRRAVALREMRDYYTALKEA